MHTDVKIQKKYSVTQISPPINLASTNRAQKQGLYQYGGQVKYDIVWATNFPESKIDHSFIYVPFFVNIWKCNL